MVKPKKKKPLKRAKLFAKYMAEVAATQREIRESSRMTGADMTLRVGGSV